MNLDALKREAAALDDNARKELFAFLVSLREKQWAEHLREAAAVLDSHEQSRWLTPEEFKKRLENIPVPRDG